ncbi:MAG: NAD(P)/FAD-dependent oxidoreductase, partial [Thiolinea sp.]
MSSAPHTDRKAVTIVGGGTVGICCALSLVQRDIPTRLIDRAAPGQATSYGNAGVISPWSFIPMALPGIWKKAPGMMLSADRPLAVRPEFWPRMLGWGSKFIAHSAESTVRHVADAMAYLCSPSVGLFRQHLQGTGHENLLVDSWYVHAFRNASKPTLDALDYRIRLEKGGELELITADELRQLEPALSDDFKAAVLIKGQARALSPGKMAEVLTQKAQTLGVEFINLEVKAIQREQQGWVIRGETGDLQAEKIILAAGIWSKQLLEPLGIKLPLVAERGYHMEFANSGVVLNNSIMDVEAKIVASSMRDGMRLAG